MNRYRKTLSIAIVASLTIAVWHFGSAVWILAKAYAAGYLIDNAWQATLENYQINKPWSWADTWPVAEMSIPAIDLNEIVLSGDSGSALAFGPGHSNASAKLDDTGLKLISGHRDTHFSKLENIAIHNMIDIKTPAGNKQYRVSDIKVVDTRSYIINTATHQYDLVLATCYPFNAVNPGGFERLLVQANEMPGP